MLTLDTVSNSDLKSCFSLAENKLLPGAELRSLLTTEAPEEIYISARAGLQCFRELGIDENQQQFMADLEVAIKALRPFEFGTYAELGFEQESDQQAIPKLRFKNFKNISLKYIGNGHFGMVYKLSTENGRAYALKIFYQRDSDYKASGPWSETALGIYLTDKMVNDMPHLCLANPRQGWILSEFVDDKFESSSPNGPSWKSFNLVNGDSFNDEKNEIKTKGGTSFRFDYGHLGDGKRERSSSSNLLEILKQQYQQSGFANPQTFLELAEKYPEIRGELAPKLFCLDPKARFAVLSKMMQYPESCHFPLHDYILGNHFKPCDTIALFNLALQHQDPDVRSQAIFSLNGLDEESVKYLCQTWQERDEFAPFMIYLGKKSFEAEILNKKDLPLELVVN